MTGFWYQGIVGLERARVCRRVGEEDGGCWCFVVLVKYFLFDVDSVSSRTQYHWYFISFAQIRNIVHTQVRGDLDWLMHGALM